MKGNALLKAPVRYVILFALCLALATLALTVPAQAQNSKKTSTPTIITFDGPGTEGGTAGPTYASSINSSGEIAGWVYLISGGVYSGFLRAADGTFVSISVPDGSVTFPTSVNDAHVIAGSYYDNNGVRRGFIRSADGTFTTFDVAVPADGGCPNNADPMWINNAGVVVGSYQYDCAVGGVNITHSFVRSPDGTITTFDPAPSGAGCSAAVFVGPTGAIVGTDHFNGDSYLRSADGLLTAIQDPNASMSNNNPCGSAFVNTWAVGMDASGVIAGFYFDANNIQVHGFLRASGGTYSTFDVPIAGTTNNNDTSVVAINDTGLVAGNYQCASGEGDPSCPAFPIGFTRGSDGTIQTFSVSVPSSRCGGTYPAAINANGAVVGSYQDGSCFVHGFVRAAPDPTKGHRGHGKGLSK